MTTYTKADLRDLMKVAEECYIDRDLYSVKLRECKKSLSSNSNYYKYANLLHQNRVMLNEVLATIKSVLESE